MTFQIIQGDCLDVMRSMDENSIDAIITDPPYYRVKNLPWDKQWNSADAFIEWVGELVEEWFRILKPNGSLYCFASPKMAARVELAIGERFNVLNHITWLKAERSYMAKTEPFLRQFVPVSERIIFAEHYNSDNIAKGQVGYLKKCGELRGFLFEPLRAYLDGERERAGVTVRDIAVQFQRKTGSRTVTGMAGHWFGRSQWELPTEENYQWLRKTMSSLNHGGEYLKREYDHLREEYEELRRPFNLTKDDPNTDVWTFKTVNSYPGKHPCEKPLDMLSHIVKTSTRENATVLDCFTGSGSTGEACLNLNRHFIGIEKDEKWCEAATTRLQNVANTVTLF